jgi:hypothetical protein
MTVLEGILIGELLCYYFKYPFMSEKYVVYTHPNFPEEIRREERKEHRMLLLPTPLDAIVYSIDRLYGRVARKHDNTIETKGTAQTS